MNKILSAFFVWFLICISCFASDLSSSIDSIINSSELSQSAIIAVKVIDAKTHNTLYSRNSSILLKPASTLKIPVSAMAFEILRPNYKLKTTLYSCNKILFLKLSADPTLTTDDLKNLFKNVDISKYNKLVIDKSFVDDNFLNHSWMWDNLIGADNVPVSIFNLDNNTLKLKIFSDEGLANVICDYPINFENELRVGLKNNIKIEKRPWEDFTCPDKIYISGQVATFCEEKIAIASPEKYFLFQLKKIAPDCKIYYGEIPHNARRLACKETSLMDILKKMNKNSNNLCAESIFKITAAEAYHCQGTFEKARKLFEEFYCTDKFVLYDGSGLSHKNLLNCDFLCNVLLKMQYNKKYRETLSVAGIDGTLKNRLREVNLQGKTGSLDGVSGLCGYLDEKYIFAIYIQNYKDRAKQAKCLEDAIVLSLHNSK